jgi:LCP family protein required for cell wall assembly
MDTTQETKKEPSKTTRRLTWALVIAFAIAALITAYLTFIAMRDFVTSWELTSLPGIALSPTQPTPTPDESGVIADVQTPLQAPSGPEPETWDGASRVSVLVMGLDYRDWSAGEGAPRTDTMILLTIDPLARTAGMLSIPRDLWVNIPGGFDYSRINTAYSLGESYKYPDGGGPGLAMATVEELLGVPIDYYAQIDFGAFVRFIDEIEGIKVDVKEKMKVDPLGDDNVKTLRPGVQTLNGELALAYARTRKTEGGDFDRAQRQQDVIFAIRDRILSADILPTLISKAPVLYQELSAGVNTNLTLEQAIKLAWLAQQVPEENIKRGVIGPPDQVLLVKSPEGDDVLKPIADKIRGLRDSIFFESGPASPVVNMPPAEVIAAENAKLRVLNGTATGGLAALSSDFLKSQGYNVVETGNADQLYTLTNLIDYTGNPYTLKYLAELMNVSSNQIYSRYDPASPVDVVVILGNDWAANNPMP